MTLITAIITKDGLVVGSDSQATMQRGVNLKRMNHTKLVKLEHSKFNTIIGGAGEVPFITKVIEEIQKEAKTANVFSDIIKIAENSILHLTRWFNFEKTKELFPQQIPLNNPAVQSDGVTKTDQIAIQYLLVILLIAGFDENNKPHIYIIHNTGVAEKQEDYGTIGSGSAYAESVLSKCFYEDLTCTEAIKITSYTIDTVKLLDPAVGGLTKIAIIQNEIRFLKDKELTKLDDETEDLMEFEEDLLEAYFKGDITAKEIRELIDEKTKK